MADQYQEHEGQKVQFIFSFDAKLEDDTTDAYNQFLLVGRENGGSTSLKLFEVIIDEEQVHFNSFDNVDDYIEKLSGTYLAQIIGHRLPRVYRFRALLSDRGLPVQRAGRGVDGK